MRVLTLLSASLFILTLTSHAVSQRIIVNSRGERIITYPDGSWRPIASGDSVLMRQYLQSTETINSYSPGKTNGNERNQGEELEYLHRQWEEFYLSVINEEKNAQQAFRLATNTQFNAGSQLRNAESNKKLIEPDHLASLQEEFDKSVLALKSAKLRQKKIRKLVGKIEKMKGSFPKLTDRKLDQIRSRFNLYLSEFNPFSTAPSDPAQKKPAPIVQKNEPVSPKTPPVPSNPVERVRNVDPKLELILPVARKPLTYVSEPFNCVFILDTLDMATERRRIETESSLIFTFTDPDLRPYFKDNDLITCRGHLSKIGPYVYLTVDFQIASSHSQSNFGSLQNGSLLRFRMLDGEYVSLYNLKSDRGRIDPYSGHTIFSGQYALGKDEITKLTRSGLDKMRVLWGTGYEDYEVYYVDFLSNQLNCLMSK